MPITPTTSRPPPEAVTACEGGTPRAPARSWLWRGVDLCEQDDLDRRPQSSHLGASLLRDDERQDGRGNQGAGRGDGFKPAWWARHDQRLGQNGPAGSADGQGGAAGAGQRAGLAREAPLGSGGQHGEEGVRVETVDGLDRCVWGNCARPAAGPKH